MASSTQSQKPTTAGVPSEDIMSAKTDLCLSNAIVKAGIGFGVGVVASAILFRRRPWPVLTGLGFGLGQGYSDCERVFNPASVPGFTIAQDAKTQSFASTNPKANEVKNKVENKANQVFDKVKEVAGEVKDKAVEVKDDAKSKLGDEKWV